ncbi:MAG: BTAD domain-containing putative transcriptional regulator [Gammaproteobacteria bacterium]|nr:BTAD domain-containing putative transcriptional regulator [Gammaproteobacteria bacterium]
MDKSIQVHDYQISTRKLAPSAAAVVRSLKRPRVMEYLHDGGANRRIFAVEGQAGQGKTTLISQFLKEYQCPNLWYQLDENDTQPIHLLAGLLSLCYHNFSDFESPFLERLVEWGETTDDKLETAVNSLVSTLERYIGNERYLILDNFQILEGHKKSIKIVQMLLDQAPKQLKFILISRLPVTLLLGKRNSPQEWLTLGNQRLAFNHDEMHRLSSEIFGNTLTEEAYQELYNNTQGWPVGLISMGHNQDDTLPSPSGIITDAKSAMLLSDIGSYFKYELLEKLPPEQRSFLSQIALLEEISTPLASAVTQREDTQKLLWQLLERHGFLYRLSRTNYTLHPLLRTYLREESQKQLSKEALNQYLRRIGNHFQEEDQTHKAVYYFLKAGDYQHTESLLQQMNARLLKIPQHTSDLEELQQLLPQKISENSGWLSLLLAAIQMETAPLEASSHFERARTLFNESDDQKGLLLLITQELLFHALIDGRHEQCAGLLSEAEPLYQSLHQQIDPYSTIYINSSLSAASLFVHQQQGPRALNDTLRIAEQGKYRDLMVHIHLLQAFHRVLTGQLNAAKEDLEVLHQALHQNQLNQLERCLTFTVVSYWLYKSANFSALKRHLTQKKELLNETLLNQTLLASVIQVLQVQMSIAEGHYAQARSLVRRTRSMAYINDHRPLHNRLMLYQGLLEAMSGESTQAAQILNELEQRITTEGPLAIHDHTLIGTIYMMLANWEPAKRHLDKAIQWGQVYDNQQAIAGALLHRIFVQIQRDETATATADINHFVSLMKQIQYPHFDLWLPRISEEVFRYAVTNNIDAEYMREISASRLDIGMDAKGNSIPILHIECLGRLDFLLHTETRLSQADLTPAQRALIALLLTTPELHMDQADIQQALWPNSPLEKARATFDALLSRLRSTFNKSLTPHSAKSYLLLKRGELYLINCQADLLLFAQEGQKGLKLSKSGKFWEASLSLYAALEKWQGEFCIGVDLAYSVRDLRDHLGSQYVQCCKALANIAATANRPHEAIQLLTEPFRADPSDENLVSTLYLLHRKIDQREKSIKILRMYRSALIEEGMGSTEANEIVVELYTNLKQQLLNSEP